MEILSFSIFSSWLPALSLKPIRLDLIKNVHNDYPWPVVSRRTPPHQSGSSRTRCTSLRTFRLSSLSALRWFDVFNETEVHLDATVRLLERSARPPGLGVFSGRLGTNSIRPESWSGNCSFDWPIRIGWTTDNWTISFTVLCSLAALNACGLTNSPGEVAYLVLGS